MMEEKEEMADSIMLPSLSSVCEAEGKRKKQCNNRSGFYDTRKVFSLVAAMSRKLRERYWASITTSDSIDQFLLFFFSLFLSRKIYAAVDFSFFDLNFRPW